MKGSDGMGKKRTRLVILALLISTIVGVLIWRENLLSHTSLVNEYVHIAVELMGSITAILISGLLFSDIKKWELDYSGIIIGFYMMGILDIFHSMCSPGTSFVFLHSLASLFGSFGVFVFIITNKYKVKVKLTKLTLLMITIISVFIGVGSMVFEDKLPIMVASGEFTLLAGIINIIGGVLFLLGAQFFYSCLKKRDDRLMQLFFVSIFLLGVGGLSFKFSELWSYSWWTWHFLRLIAQLILIGFIYIVYEENRNIIISQNEEIKGINKKLSDYSFTISHDLKEPVRSIRTFSQFIKDDYEDNLDEEGLDYLSRIIKASIRMAAMIDDLLELSRVGRMDIEFRKEDVGELLKEVEAELKVKMEETNTSITVGPLPVMVCQRVWIQSVLRNLISNSIKYGNLEKTEINIKYSETMTHYEFFIRDNGQGIEEDQHEKIFGLFRRAAKDKSSVGSGAGLAIVSAVIDEHKGSVAVECSEPGKGTTIKFTIAKELSNVHKRRKEDV